MAVVATVMRLWTYLAALTLLCLAFSSVAEAQIPTKTFSLLPNALKVELVNDAPPRFTRADPEYRSFRRTAHLLAFAIGVGAGVGVWQATAGSDYCYDNPSQDDAIRRAKWAVGATAVALSVGALIWLLRQKKQNPGLRLGIGARLAPAISFAGGFSGTMAGFGTTSICGSS